MLKFAINNSRLAKNYQLSISAGICSLPIANSLSMANRQSLIETTEGSVQ